eukprot:CAMPEP_0181092528 /NCGR_PEP_ID=MMETSP1071-20121207/8965_1 /TAXON_ID=35127 /ORGANISM="Thalassiosira sp., Strain NH16" /LENGTH=190 /DNA_ID=CAMNT_0023174711 /DNA_START=1557 /DNA_END=2126 /DNA_ORIENTATION=-
MASPDQPPGNNSSEDNPSRDHPSPDHVSVGELVGDRVGIIVGNSVGDMVGRMVGETVGYMVGKSVGDSVGESVGTKVGDSVGDILGDSVGVILGGGVVPPPLGGRVSVMHAHFLHFFCPGCLLDGHRGGCGGFDFIDREDDDSSSSCDHFPPSVLFLDPFDLPFLDFLDALFLLVVPKLHRSLSSSSSSF